MGVCRCSVLQRRNRGVFGSMVLWGKLALGIVELYCDGLDCAKEGKYVLLWGGELHVFHVFCRVWEG